jgi:hypothetical protein
MTVPGVTSRDVSAMKCRGPQAETIFFAETSRDIITVLSQFYALFFVTEISKKQERVC